MTFVPQNGKGRCLVTGKTVTGEQGAVGEYFHPQTQKHKLLVSGLRARVEPFLGRRELNWEMGGNVPRQGVCDAVSFAWNIFYC